MILLHKLNSKYFYILARFQIEFCSETCFWYDSLTTDSKGKGNAAVDAADIMTLFALVLFPTNYLWVGLLLAQLTILKLFFDLLSNAPKILLWPLLLKSMS